MDADYWASRLAAAAAKRQFQLHQSSHLDRLSIDDFDVEDDVRPEFSCPYCYEEFDIASLCSHLEDDHSCESRVTFCPVCSVKVSRDMFSHITLQHGHLFKLQRLRRLRKVAIPNSQALSLLGRDLREAQLQVLLGGAGYRSNNASVPSIATDPLLSSLLLNFPTSEVEEISRSVINNAADDTSTKKAAPTHIWKQSFDPSLTNEEREKRMKQAAGRAGFVQDILVSTLLRD